MERSVIAPTSFFVSMKRERKSCAASPSLTKNPSPPCWMKSLLLSKSYWRQVQCNALCCLEMEVGRLRGDQPQLACPGDRSIPGPYPKFEIGTRKRWNSPRLLGRKEDTVNRSETYDEIRGDGVGPTERAKADAVSGQNGK